jgi:IclR family transcriptional regulator, KDG regulon repressor
MGSTVVSAPRRSEETASYSLSVSRAMRLLNLFTPERGELGITEIARALALPKASVQRLVQALVRHDFLDQSQESRKYRIGVGAFQIGSLFVQHRTLERVATPFLHELVAETGHTSHVSVLRDGFMIVTASIEGPGPIKYSLPVGYRLALTTSAVGKAALSLLGERVLGDVLARGMPKLTPHSLTDPARFKEEMQETRARGYSVNWEENRPGVGSVAAPIAAPDGSPTAVLSLGFPVSLVRRDALPGLGRAVADKAGRLAQALWQGEARRSPTATQGDPS